MRHNELRAQLQSFLPTQASPRTSQRYVPVNTLEVVDSLVDQGFQIQSIGGAYSNALKDPFAKHRVTMINPDISLTDGTCARAIITNSFDGRSALKLIAGLYRFACENGLVIGAVGKIAKLSQKHVNGIEEAILQINEYTNAIPQMRNLVAGLQEIEVQDDLLTQLAKDAAALRQQVIWGSKFTADQFDVDVESMVEVLRSDDAERDAWTVFNVLQEKVIRGGYHYKPFGKGESKIAKAIKNPMTEDKINTKLFQTYAQSVSYTPYEELV